jgi:chloramphenicol 3-O-phosphotransferase
MLSATWGRDAPLDGRIRKTPPVPGGHQQSRVRHPPSTGATSSAYALFSCHFRDPGVTYAYTGAATPERFQPGIGLRPGAERPDLEPLVEILYPAMYEAIAAHSRLGVNVVADTTHHDHYSQPLNILANCARIVSGLPVLFVGVQCPIEAVMQRRLQTWGSGYNDDGSIPDPILRWQQAVSSTGR